MLSLENNYLDTLMNNMGEIFDFAVNEVNVNIDTFYNMFVNSIYPKAFEELNNSYIFGKSGIEIALDILESNNITTTHTKYIRYDYSSEYWCGWILAYYQFKTNRPYSNIKEYLKISELTNLYKTLHEASLDKSFGVINELVKSRETTSNLQKRRKLCGYTQNALAILSGISKRTIEQYENKSKDINKAAVKTVLTLARVLYCKVEDIIEY